jgi:predicted SAM-dependent methyltransferase
MKLCLGSGNEFHEGFVHVDRRNIRRPTEDTMFLRADVRRLDRYFFPNSVDVIYAHDLLEHFPSTEVEGLLRSWVGLLKPGGRLELRVPELRRLAQYILDSKETDAEKSARVYGGQEYPSNFHLSGFTEPMLAAMLASAGMTGLEYSTDWRTNLVVSGRKL